jgi:hypothetical protein
MIDSLMIDAVIKNATISDASIYFTNSAIIFANAFVLTLGCVSVLRTPIGLQTKCLMRTD